MGNIDEITERKTDLEIALNISRVFPLAASQLSKISFIFPITTVRIRQSALDWVDNKEKGL